MNLKQPPLAMSIAAARKLRCVDPVSTKAQARCLGQPKCRQRVVWSGSPDIDLIGYLQISSITSMLTLRIASRSPRQWTKQPSMQLASRQRRVNG